eukprot:COSAG02_NODE_9537_length_2186_cov_3.102060_4_plen_181_part_00
MGTAVVDELLVQYGQQAHGPATASTVASILVARLPALYTNLARRADDMASQAVALAENAAATEKRQAETLREALNASIQAEALVSARLATLEKSLDELQQQTEVRSNSISLNSLHRHATCVTRVNIECPMMVFLVANDRCTMQPKGYQSNSRCRDTGHAGKARQERRTRKNSYGADEPLI